MAELSERMAAQEREVIGMGREIKEIKGRLLRQDELLSELMSLRTDLGVLRERMDYIIEDIEKNARRVEAMDAVPKKRWEQLVLSMISALTAALAGYFFGRGG
ncbi:hypothetical protein [Gehongia tenuis]|uniref:Uncharacterized protein n=1 Tax=Gehongia tenuis TaxID=2763655 RepID=A0A926HK48_9FIRM|nr:hypothetical protein [Gehongia tenuis]MBC8530582.1 hypothetical protein [Gehongia tenuis]